MLLATKQVMVSFLRDQHMARQPTPGCQIDRHTGVGRSNLECLTGGETTHEVSNFIQWPSTASFITSVIKGICLEDRDAGIRGRCRTDGYLTGERSPGCLPFLLVQCLAGTEVDALRPE